MLWYQQKKSIPPTDLFPVGTGSGQGVALCGRFRRTPLLSLPQPGPAQSFSARAIQSPAHRSLEGHTLGWFTPRCELLSQSLIHKGIYSFHFGSCGGSDVCLF